MVEFNKSCVVEDDEIAHVALDKLKQLLRRPEFFIQRKQRMEQALLCLQRGESVPQILSLLISIISTYPTTSKKRRKKKHSISGVIESLDDRFSILDLFFHDLSRYKAAIHSTLSSNEQHVNKTGQDSTNTNSESPLASARYSHLQQTTIRLEFLSFILSNSRLSLSFVQVKELWNLLHDQAVLEDERQACIQWIETARKGSSPHALRTVFDESVTDRIFDSIILRIPPRKISENLFSLVRTFFIHINVRSGNLHAIPVSKNHQHRAQKQNISHHDKTHQHMHYRKRKLQAINDRLIGVQYLWSVVVEADNPNVSRSARKLLNVVHHEFGREALANAPQYREAYIQQAVERLNEYASQLRHREQKENYSAQDKEVGLDGNKQDRDGCEISNNELSELRLRRVLDLLQEYITLFRRGGRRAQGKEDPVGKPLCMTVAVAGKPELTFKMTVYSSDSIGHITAIVARELSLPDNLIQITYKDRSLYPLSALLKEFNLPNEATVFVTRRTVKEAAVDTVLRVHLGALGMRTDGLSQAMQAMDHRKHSDLAQSTGANICSAHNQSNGTNTPQPSENNNATASSDLITYGDTDGASDANPSRSVDSTDSGEYVVLSNEDDADSFPAAILARDEYFTCIIDLLSLGDAVASEAWSLLMMLPSNRKVLDSLRHFEESPTDNTNNNNNNNDTNNNNKTTPSKLEGTSQQKSWTDVLDSSSVYKLLYALQIMDVLRQDSSDPTWSSTFVQRGGLQHLVHIITSSQEQQFDHSLLHLHCLTLLLKTVAFFLGHTSLTDGKGVTLLKTASVTESDLKDLINKVLHTVATATQSIKMFKSNNIIATTTTAFDPASTERDLIEQSFALLATVVQIDATLLQDIYQHECLAEWLRRSLLQAEPRSIRSVFARGFHRMLICDIKNSPKRTTEALSHIVPYMLTLLPEAANNSSRCDEFFDLLVDLLSDILSAVKDGAIDLPFHAESHLRNIVDQILGADTWRTHRYDDSGDDNRQKCSSDKTVQQSNTEQEDEKEEEEKIEDRNIEDDNEESDDDDDDDDDDDNDDKNHEAYYIGLLRVAEALLRCVPSSIKLELGHKKGRDLVRKLTYGMFQIDIDDKEENNNNQEHVDQQDKNTEYIQSSEKMLQFHTKRSRKAALGVLAELIEDCPENYDAVAGQVYNLLYQCETPGPRAWAVSPTALERPRDPGFVGLRNQGATCYMNSLIQQLFMTYGFRRGIFSAAVSDPTTTSTSPSLSENDNNDSHNEDDNNDNIQLLLQLQRMFGFLQESEKQFYDTLDFCMHYKDFGGEAIDLKQQQDANEFLSVLFDRLEQALKGTPQKSLLSDVFGGTLANELLSLDEDCGHGRTGTEPFYTVGLEIKGKRNIEESLASYIQGEILDKDNKWKCDACQRRVPARKRSMFKQLPPMLILQLKRFEFDLRHMRNVKVNDRCEFPTRLDMQPYTVQGVAAEESADGEENHSNTTNATSGGTIPDEDKNQVTEYELVGVLVHSGTANSGHYYSFIKDTDIFEQTGKWIEFNDHVVRYFDPEEMEDACFGGTKDVVVTVQGKQVTQPCPRPHNAYMLFYRRRDIDRNFVPTTITKAQNAMNASTVHDKNKIPDEHKVNKDKNKDDSIEEDAEHVDDTEAEQEDNQGKNLWKQTTTAMRFLSRMQVSLGRKEAELSAANGMPPFVKRMVREDNKKFLRSKAIFNPQFDAFMWRLLSSSTRCKSKIFTDKTAVQLATRFVVDILAHSRHKQSLPQWFDLLRDLLSSNVELCKWLIMALTPSAPDCATNWFSDILVNCPFSEVRSAFVEMVIGCVYTLSPKEKYRPDLLRADIQQGHSPTSPGTGEHSLLDEKTSEEEEKEVKAELDQRRQLYHDHSLTFFIYHVVEMVHSCRMQQRTSTQLFLLACRIAGVGPEERSFLLQLGMLSAVVDVLTPVGSSGNKSSANQSLASLPKSGVVHLITLSSLLLRSCRPREGVLPPTAMDECRNSLPASDKRFFTPQFLLRLIHDNPHPPAQREILRHWCWESANVSYNIAEAVIRKLDDVPPDQYTNYFEAITTILNVEDSVAEYRVKRILDHFLERLERRSKDAISTLARIRYITRLNNNENCKAWMQDHMADLENICTQHGWQLRHKNQSSKETQ